MQAATVRYQFGGYKFSPAEPAGENLRRLHVSAVNFFWGKGENRQFYIIYPVLIACRRIIRKPEHESGIVHGASETEGGERNGVRFYLTRSESHAAVFSEPKPALKQPLRKVSAA